MKRIFFLLTAVALLVSCRHEDRPAGILDEPQMVAFLCDAYLLEGFYAIETQYRYDAMTPEVLRAYDDILAHHGITREEAEASFAYYAQHPELYQTIQDSVLARIDQTTSSDTLASESSSPASDFRLTL